jgi:hypothetical protein
MAGVKRRQRGADRLPASRMRLSGQRIFADAPAGRWGARNEPGCRAEAIPAVIMESQNSPGPFGPGELAVLVSDQ